MLSPNKSASMQKQLRPNKSVNRSIRSSLEHKPGGYRGAETVLQREKDNTEGGICVFPLTNPSTIIITIKLLFQLLGPLRLHCEGLNWSVFRLVASGFLTSSRGLAISARDSFPSLPPFMFHICVSSVTATSLVFSFPSFAVIP